MFSESSLFRTVVDIKTHEICIIMFNDYENQIIIQKKKKKFILGDILK